MILPEWLAAVFEREFNESQRSRIAEVITAVNASTLSAEELERGYGVIEGNSRFLGAVILIQREGDDLEETLETATWDWRDLLLGTGLEHEDWPIVLAEKLGGPSDGAPLIG
ncbi:hypothetical protein ABZ348_02730 [Streptomyces sp. NPDC005963]|uniref:hypothetical protein n=1 Tax=Streptomyces sp. NPDC005963 TaxID=3156721 RepID=UPI0033CB3D0B